MNSLSTARFLLCVLAAAASSGLGNQRRVSAADGPPNVVVIITDDQGYGDLGFFGNRVLRTPALDRLAAASARLSSFYVSPVCAPTRASLMTGRYNYRTRAIDTYRGRALMDPDRDDHRAATAGRGLCHRAVRQMAPGRHLAAAAP
ncbi:MAG: sulfatase-like hydrolase/transferase [Planctomycetaceae bacterium]